MKTYSEPQSEVVAENNLASNIIQKKERNKRILYVFLGIGVLFLAVGLVSFLVK